jgi:hypothetical protein
MAVIAEAYLVANGLAQWRVQFFGNSRGDTTGSDTSRLGVAYEPGGASTKFQAEFG